jgi:hypothetical protein
VRVQITAETLNVSTTGYPDHKLEKANPNRPSKQNFNFKIPRHLKIASRPTAVPSCGPIAVAIRGGSKGKLKFDQERIELKFLTIYSEENDKITSINTFGRMQYDHYFKKKWYRLLSMKALNDKLKNLNLRLAVLSGVGHHLKDDDVKSLKLEVGVTYFSEVYSFSNDMIVFPSFSKTGELKLHNEASLDTRLKEVWSLNLSHTLDYNNDAPKAHALLTP